MLAFPHFPFPVSRNNAKDPWGYSVVLSWWHLAWLTQSHLLPLALLSPTHPCLIILHCRPHLFSPYRLQSLCKWDADAELTVDFPDLPSRSSLPSRIFLLCMLYPIAASETKASGADEVSFHLTIMVRWGVEEEGPYFILILVMIKCEKNGSCGITVVV